MAKSPPTHSELERVLPRLSALKAGNRELRRLRRCALELDRIGPIARPKGKPKGQILLVALTQSAIRARGKVEPDLFFPDFCARLAARGYQPDFVFHADELLDMTRKAPSCVIHLYGEEHACPDDPLLAEAHATARLVFNHPDTGAIIRDKIATNRHLTACGIPMPSMEIGAEDKVFSNAVDRTSHPAWVASASDAAKDRYNTRYIDSRSAFDGEE